MPFRSEAFESESQAAAYLAGMFDGEGTISASGVAARRISIANTQRDLLMACGEACDMLGIAWRIYARSSPSRPEHWSQAYDLVIYGMDNLVRFNEVVPFRSTRKREKLTVILASFRFLRRRRANWPVDELRSRYEDGASIAELAQHFQVGSATVHRWMRAADIPSRSLVEAAALDWTKRRAA